MGQAVRPPLGSTSDPRGPGSPESAPQAAVGEAHVLDRVQLLLDLANHLQRASDVVRELARIRVDERPDPGLLEGVDERPKLLTANDLASMLQVAVKSIRKWRREDLLPPSIELGGVIRWRSSVVAEWIEELEENQR